MNQSSAILNSTAMDKMYGDATTLETVAKINAFTREVRVQVKNDAGEVVKDENGNAKVKVEHRTFIAVNDLPAISIEQVDFGQATPLVVMVNTNYGSEAVDAICKNALRGNVAYLVDEDEFVNNLAINITKQNVMDWLEFYKLMNA